jgi:hypothetical protein
LNIFANYWLSIVTTQYPGFSKNISKSGPAVLFGLVDLPLSLTTTG